MLESQQKRIGDIDYQVTQLPAPAGRRLLVRLYKVLGPALAAALKSLPESSGGISLGELQTSAIGDAMFELAQSITEDELDHVCNVFASQTLFSRESGKWLPLKDFEDSHWSGNYLQMFQWIGFCLEANYSSFLSGAGGLKGLSSQILQTKESNSQPKSTGKSTESQVRQDTQPH